MTAIRYIQGGSVDARQRLLDGRLSAWKGGAVLHLVPTRGTIIELEADPRFWLLRRQDTLTGLIHRIFEDDIRHRQFENRRPVDDGIRSLIVKKALEKRSMQPDGLIYFNRLLTDHDEEIAFPGIFRSVAGFFSQLVRNNYQDRFVNDLDGKIIRLEEKGAAAGEEIYALESDLAWLFGDYEEIKKEIRVYDEDDVLSGVRDFLGRGNIPTRMKGTDVIIFDGFIHLTRIEEDILYYLFAGAKEVWWPIDYDGDAEDPVSGLRHSTGRGVKRAEDATAPCDQKVIEAYRVFAPMASFMERLEADGFQTGTERCDKTPFLNPLAQGLYIDGLPGRTEVNSLRIRSFNNRVEEVRAIAREIKRIIHEDGLDVSKDLGKIRIIFPELREYSSIIHEIFKEYGIPFSLTMGLPLFSHPISNIFLLILKIPLDHFKRGDIFRLFSSVLIRKRAKACPCPEDGHMRQLLERHLLPGDDASNARTLIRRYTGKDAAVNSPDIELFDSIARRCGLNTLGDDLSWPDNAIPCVGDFYQAMLKKAVDPDERDRLRGEFYMFILQSALLDRWLEPFKSLIDQESPHGILNAIFSILKELGFPENIMDMTELSGISVQDDKDSMIRRDIKAYSILKDLVSGSASELMVENDLFKAGSGRQLLSKFYRIFMERLERSYLIDERNPNVIRISQWLEIRGRSFDYIFAGGLTDAGFPLREETGFIIPESYKNIFRIPDNIDLSRYLFSHLLRNYRKGLYLSCPAYAEGKEVLPSNVFLDIESMMTGSSQEQGMTESPFKWDDSPYLSSPLEMLDSSIIKGDSPAGSPETPFPLKYVVVKDEAGVEGILRGVRAMGSRWAINGLFEYDGLACDATAFGRFLKERRDIFSASQLETLANCPMRYLFERVYGLKKTEGLEPEASPMEMGEHLHSLLAVFFSRLHDLGKNVSDTGISQAFLLARETAEAYFRDIPFLKRIEFFEHQKDEFLAGLDQAMPDSADLPVSREGAFALLLRFEEREFRDMLPGGIEYGFGFDGLSSPVLGKVRLRGYIDRFDRDRNDGRRFYIYDYKTGVAPSTALIKKGLSFQLPVYIRALKKNLQAVKITAAIYSLRKDNLFKKNPLGQYICDHSDEAGGLDISGAGIIDRYADELIELLEAGRFHHSADMLNCGWCDFRYACHMDERRMAHLLDSGGDHGIYSGNRNLESWKELDDFRGKWKKVREGMKKAFNLKTESGRRNHYESVLAFGKNLADNRNSQPLDGEYIDELIAEIEGFQKRFLSSASSE